MLKKIVISSLLIMLVGNILTTGTIHSIEREKILPVHKNDEPLNIVASISIVADYTAQVGKGLFTVESIVSGNENPHIYEPTTSEIEMVANADLFVRMGLDGLEPWVQNVLDVNPGLNVLELVDPATMMEYDPIIDAPNPHVWMSPNISKVMVEKIYDEIAVLDPSNNNTYTTNKNNYLVELDDLLDRINSSRTQFEGMKVIVHHPAFKYLLDLLGIIRVGAIETREGSEPSPEHIQQLMEDIVSENVSLVINQPQLSDEVVNQIARETNIKIANLTPLLGILGLDNYIDMIDYNLAALANPVNPPSLQSDWVTWLLVGIGGGAVVATIIALVVVRIKKPRVE